MAIGSSNSATGYTLKYPVVTPDQDRLNLPGSLIIADFFTPDAGWGGDPHGDAVAFAARFHGFSGPLVARNLPQPPELKMAQSAMLSLGQTTQSAQEVRDTLKNYAVDTRCAILSGAAQELEEVREAGANHSAVNLSVGVSKAGLLENLYDNLAPAWQPDAAPEARRQADLALDNYARGFGLDAQALRAPEGGAERAKLNQNLIDFVSQSCDSSDQVKSATSQYDKAVASLEQSKVSVVVAGENEGDLLTQMTAQSGGNSPQIPLDFYHNPLSNGNTTTVGATRFDDQNGNWVESVASYSSPSRDIEVYAWGSVGTPQDPQAVNEWGTSFATPRVAAAEARLHQLHPDLSNAQVESLLQKTLTHKLPEYGSEPVLPVLDDSRTQQLMAG